MKKITLFLILLVCAALIIGSLATGVCKAQILTSEQNDFQAFIKKHKGDWQAFYSEETGRIRDIWGDVTIRYGSTATDAARQFVNKNEPLINAKSGNLVLAKVDNRKKSAHAIFRQTYRGLPLEGAVVLIHLNKQGSVVWVETLAEPNVRLRSTTPKVTAPRAEKRVAKYIQKVRLPIPHPRTKLVVLPMGKGKFLLSWKVRFATKNPPGDWIYYVDAISGKIVSARNDIYYATGKVTANILPIDGNSSLQKKPIANQYVTVKGKRTTTNADGSYSVSSSGNVSARLEGPFATIINEDTTSASYSGKNLTWTWEYATSNTHFNEVNTFYHVNLIHDFFKSNYNINQMESQIAATVHKGDNYANAYYNPADKNLYFGDGDGQNTRDSAKCAEVIYHEYGHATHDHIYDVITDTGIYSMQIRSMGEAWADYFAEVLTNDDVFGEWWIVQASQRRNLNNTKKYPDDMEGEEHADGPIFAGALWDYRKAVGANIVDPEVAASWFYRPTDFRSGLIAMLQADDELFGDFNLSNGTPHQQQILQAFSDHGLSTAIDETLRPVVVGRKNTAAISNLYMMNPDGSNAGIIPGTRTWEWPDWNEDRRLVAASGYDVIGNICVYVIDPLAGISGKVTGDLMPTGIVYALYPSLSPGGDKVAYSWGYQGQAMLNLATNDTVNPDPLKPMGTEVPNVDSMDAGANQWYPDWSKANNKIVYAQLYGALLNKSYTGLWVVNPDGSGLTQITHPSWYYGAGFVLYVEDDMYPKWSRTGGKIAYVKFTTGTPIFGNYTYDYDIYIMNADGSDAPGTRILRGRDSFPITLQATAGLGLGDLSWSAADGSIMFGVANSVNSLGTPTSYDIWRVNVDGTNITRVTNDGGTATSTWGSLDTSAPTVNQVAIQGKVDNKNSLTFAINASDSESGVYNFQYAIGSSPGATDARLWTTVKGSATQVTASRLTLINGTTYYVSVKARNAVGLVSNVATSQGVKAEIDTTKPSTRLTSSPSSPNGKSGWFKTKPLITLTVNETSTTYYRVDSGSTKTYSSRFKLSDGKHRIYYFSVDRSENTENTHTHRVNVDSYKPKALITAKGFSIKKPSASIRYKLKESFGTQIRTTLLIKRGKSTIRTLFKNKLKKATAKGITHRTKWDGKNIQKRFVQRGVYTIVLILTDQAGNRNVKRKSLKVI